MCTLNPSINVVLRIANECDKGKVSNSGISEICSARTESLSSQLKISNWLEMLKNRNLFTDGAELYPMAKKILEDLPDNRNTRIDIGTSLGVFMMAEPFYSNVPELPVYYNQATLMKTLWNYQIAVFNQKKTVWPEDSIMPELAKYFGIGYTLISEDLVPLDKFQRTGWERVAKAENNIFAGLALWKYKDSVGLLRVTTKPTVLVIGQDKVDGYFRIFHLATLGVIPFDEALVTKGGSFVDDYSLEELSKFDAVFLEGYTYKDKKKGWEVLNSYVKKGGSLFINTGWQYSSADWQTPNTPEFIPLRELKWIDPGKVENYSLDNSQIIQNTDISKFSPLIFGTESWFISSSDRESDLRDWAKVILSANGRPLVAGGEYGLGKIIWTGLDLPGHIGAYEDNPEEVLFYKELVSYLLKGKAGKVLNASYQRDYPDKLVINLDESSDQKTTVYWSEAYHPDFKAKLIEKGQSQNLKVYKAGPGMVLFMLSKVSAGDKIIFEYKTPFIISIAKLISFTTLILILIFVVKPKILRTLFGYLIIVKNRVMHLKNENLNY
jgi:hypothetical protein